MAQLQLPDFATPSGEAVLVDKPLSEMRPERVKTIWNEVQYQLSRRPHVDAAIVMDFAEDRLKVMWEPKEPTSTRSGVEFR